MSGSVSDYTLKIMISVFTCTLLSCYCETVCTCSRAVVRLFSPTSDLIVEARLTYFNCPYLCECRERAERPETTFPSQHECVEALQIVKLPVMETDSDAAAVCWFQFYSEFRWKYKNTLHHVIISPLIQPLCSLLSHTCVQAD